MIYEHLSAKIVLSQAERRALHGRHSSLAKARLGSVDYYPFSFSPPAPIHSQRVNCDYVGGDIYGYVFDENSKYEQLIFIPKYIILSQNFWKISRWFLIQRIIINHIVMRVVSKIDFKIE